MSARNIFFIILVLILLLGWRFIQFYRSHPPYHDGQQVSLVTTLQADPQVSYKGQKISIKTPTNQLISVNASLSPRYHYGQVVHIHGKLKAFTFPDGKTIFTLYRPKITLEKEAANPIAAIANAIRLRTEVVYRAILPSIPASLLMGMVFGANEQFPDDFHKSLQNTGVLHVIAASGMNVTFVSAAVLYTLGLFLKRKRALSFGCVAIIFYVFLVGFQPSIIRASIMGLLAFGVGILGRQHIAIFALLVSGYLLLLWQPNFLFDVGFQLSFMATLGIMFLKPLIPLPDNAFTESFTTTLAAELGTLPILLTVFGQIGLFSILVNALVLWTVPVIMLFGSLAALFGLVFAPLGYLFLYPAFPFLYFFQTVIIFFGSSSFVIQGVSLPSVVWVGYYCLLGALVIFHKKKVRESLRQSKHIS